MNPNSYILGGSMIREDYFENIDTRDKAYFFGLLYSDGNVYKRKDRPNTYRVQLKLIESDRYIIDKFKEYINCNPNVRIEKDGARLIFSNTKVALDLIRHGCIENKSKTKLFPEIKEELFYDFLRGYFDGNGSVSVRKFTTYFRIYTGSRNFAKGLQEKLSSLGYTCGLFDKIDDKNCGVAELCIGRREQVNQIYDKMYFDTDLFLHRKKEKLK